MRDVGTWNMPMSSCHVHFSYLFLVASVACLPEAANISARRETCESPLRGAVNCNPLQVPSSCGGIGCCRC